MRNYGAFYAKVLEWVKSQFDNIVGLNLIAESDDIYRFMYNPVRKDELLIDIIIEAQYIVNDDKIIITRYKRDSRTSLLDWVPPDND